VLSLGACTSSLQKHCSNHMCVVTLAVTLGLSCAVFCVAAHAQTAGTGAVGGIITDPSGAIVADAEVKATNEATGEIRTVSSAVDGSYMLALLLPGLYELEVARSGFKTVHLTHVHIFVAEAARLNVRLDLGTVTERITVKADVGLLQTESSALGRVTDGEQVRTLPLVTRNYTQIVALNPGVAADVTDAGVIGVGFNSPVSNGGTVMDNNFQMNGVGINDLQSSGAISGNIAIPNPDTIQEFKVQTGQYDAAFGRNAGANVDVITKSGTKDFHGGLWEFFRNDLLNANSFFRNKTNQPRPVLKQNQFGFDLGGPIKKDRLLLFTSYQGTRQRNGIDGSCASQITSPPITDDRSPEALGVLFAGQRGTIQTTIGAGLASPGDPPVPIGPAIKADGSNINPVALTLLQMKLPSGAYVIPTPQTVDSSRPFESQGFSAFSFACPYTENQFMANGDWEISARSRLNVRFFAANSDAGFTLPLSNGGTAPGFPVALINNYRNVTFTQSYIFSPHLVNQAIAGYHRTFALFDQATAFSYSSIGATVPSFDDNIPSITLDLGSPTGLSLGGSGQGTRIAQNTYTLQDSLFYQAGRHKFRFGAGLTREQENQGSHTSAAEGFLSWPDFLLGLDAEGNGTAPFDLASSNLIFSSDRPGLFDRAFRVWETNAYAQDDFSVSPRLTLNLGFRYERLGDIADAMGRNASLDPALLDRNPATSGTLAGYVVPSNYSGGAIPPGVTQGENQFAVKGDGQNTWNPRVGLAWQLPHTNRMVLRAGYGVYHSRYTGQPFSLLLNVPPFALNRFFIFGSNAAATEAVPLPLTPVNIPSFPAYSPATALGIATFDPHFRPPIMQEYSLGIQTQLADDIVLDVGYSGARGLHLIRGRSINQAGIASPTSPIRGETTNTLANVMFRVPFQGWDSANFTQIESAGASWYNALLVGLNKRFGHGLQAQVCYTFSRNLTTDPLTSVDGNGGISNGDQNNPKLRYGPDFFVREQRVIANFTYQFPGPQNLSSPKGRVLGGWGIAGVTTFQSGHKLLVIFNPNGQNIFGQRADRASLSGACRPGHYLNPGSVTANLNGYINVSCFAKPALFSADDPFGLGFGNSGVGIFDGPGQNNFDLSFTKKLAFRWPRENSFLEFRSEFFNAFNHPQFCDPDVLFNSGTFGQISCTSVAPRIIQFALKFTF
jgi:carboxypeptidase family protein/TonB-dependent receptor-like protein